MRILVLGGTVFLGRHFVAAAVAAGHAVTLFHRGTSTCVLPSGVEEILGDRLTDLVAALGDREWDFVVDTSGNSPQDVRVSAHHLSGRVGCYLFVSTVSVYSDVSRPGLAEDGPLLNMTDDAKSMSAAELYGANKAAAETVVREVFGERAVIVRPGLIAGRWDPTDRFTYWAERALRGGAVLGPGSPSRPVQFIDARDLAEWFVRMGEDGVGGTFIAVGPAYPLTMETFIQSMIVAAASFNAPPATIEWVDDAVLFRSGVAPWVEMPLWLPNDQTTAGLLQMNATRAIEAGLTFRPIEQTAADVMQWVSTLPPDRERKAGLDRNKEIEILQWDR